MSFQHGIDVEQSSSSVIICINDKLETTSSSFPPNTIFKVHALLRRENEMAYEPEILAIGPYHRGKDRLRVMEDRKLRFFKVALKLIEERNTTKYVEAIQMLEPEARECYSESTEHINKDEFVEMLLLDACFIIQFMRCFLSYDTTTYPFFQHWTGECLISDMLLFENQIPLFVLQELFSLIKLPQEPDYFLEYAFAFLNVIMQNQFGVTKQLSLSGHDNGIQHMLGFSHYIVSLLAANYNDTHLDDLSVNENNKPFELARLQWQLQHAIKLCKRGFKFINKIISIKLCSCDQPIDIEVSFDTMPSASKLHAAGVKFRCNKVNSNPFEITFENGIMEITKLLIVDTTEGFYRNLIAYEQYNKEPINRCVGLHAQLMDCLIDTTEDVALLRSFGILENLLGDDEAISNMFNKLSNRVYVSDHPSKDKLFKDVNAYYGKRRHKWMAKLRLQYFNSPWAWISFLAAFLLLMLTLTQTVCSILGLV